MILISPTFSKIFTENKAPFLLGHSFLIALSDVTQFNKGPSLLALQTLIPMVKGAFKNHRKFSGDYFCENTQGVSKNTYEVALPV